MAHARVVEAEKLLDREFKVLDHGFVRLIDYMGSDQAIVQAARVSYGEGTKKISENRGLIRYLMRNRHTSPFEMVEVKFHVKLPIFVARQWIRHRTANVNELSGRYSIMRQEFFRPDPGEIKLQSRTNKQGRSSEKVAESLKEQFLKHLEESQMSSYEAYDTFVNAGLARELARINLPLSLYTEWYWKIDLHNLFHFLRLRLDNHAQTEIREYADVMANIVKAICPLAYEAFIDYSVNAHAFSGTEMQILSGMVKESECSLEALIERGLSKREALEFLRKLRNEQDEGAV